MPREEAPPIIDLFSAPPVDPSFLLPDPWRIPRASLVSIYPCLRDHPNPDKLVVHVSYFPNPAVWTDETPAKYHIIVTPPPTRSHRAPGEKPSLKLLPVSLVSAARFLTEVKLWEDRTAHFTSGESIASGELCYMFGGRGWSVYRGFAYHVDQGSGLNGREDLSMAQPSGSGDRAIANASQTKFVPLEMYEPLDICVLSGRVIYSGMDSGGGDWVYIVDYLA